MNRSYPGKEVGWGRREIQVDGKAWERHKGTEPHGLFGELRIVVY